MSNKSPYHYDLDNDSDVMAFEQAVMKHFAWISGAADHMGLNTYKKDLERGRSFIINQLRNF